MTDEQPEEMMDSQPDEVHEPMTQVRVLEILVGATTWAKVYLQSAKYSKLGIEEADDLHAAIQQRSGFHISVSLCLDNIWQVLSWRWLLEEIDAGIHRSAEVFDIPEDIAPETLEISNMLAHEAEAILDELNTLTA